MRVCVCVPERMRLSFCNRGKGNNTLSITWGLNPWACVCLWVLLPWIQNLVSWQMSLSNMLQRDVIIHRQYFFDLSGESWIEGNWACVTGKQRTGEAERGFMTDFCQKSRRHTFPSYVHVQTVLRLLKHLFQNIWQTWGLVCNTSAF